MDKRRMKPIQQFLAILLCLAMVLPMALPANAGESKGGAVDTGIPSGAPVAAPDAASDGGGLDTLYTSENATKTNTAPLAVVYAASDFQLKTSDNKADYIEGGKNIMNSIIKQMQAAGYKKGSAKAVTGALFCGDYTGYYNTWGTGTEEEVLKAAGDGAKAVEEVLNTAWGLTDEQVVYVQGNHDFAGFENQDPSGNNDVNPLAYGVYVLHEDDFPWKQGVTTKTGNTGDAEATVQATAAALKAYLQEKLEQKYDRPIFVCAHVPLHYGYRTFMSNSQDNIYAKYVFDVLNEYGAKLNIIYLFGHDHSGYYDDYIGGAAVYLPVNSKILVPKAGENSSYTEETLSFTYMNAGYVGFYNGACATKLSSTVFEIYEDKVVIARYGTTDGETYGKVNLKDKGIEYKNTSKNWVDPTVNETIYGDATIDLKTLPVEMDLSELSSGRIVVEDSAELSISGKFNTTYEVEWKSENPDVVTVTPSADGMTATLTANRTGAAKITAEVTETGKIRAAAEPVILDYTVEVVSTTASAVKTLVAKGTEYTFFKKVNKLTAGKTYMLVDLENDGSDVGRHMALHYNRGRDLEYEADVVSANNEEIRQYEVNAYAVNAFQLPINGTVETLIVDNRVNLHWLLAKNSKNQTYIKTLNTDVTADYYYLTASESDHATSSPDYYTTDADHDGIRMGALSATTPGSRWGWNATRGLNTGTTDDGFRYILYYSQAQQDFSAYRWNNGDSDASGDLLSEIDSADSHVHLFEQTTVTVANAITAYLDDVTGYVNKDVGYKVANGNVMGSIKTGDKIIITDGTTTTKVDVTLDMITGTLDINTPGTYTGLTVTYAGKKLCTTYTLVVRDTVTLLKNGTVAHGAATEYMDTIYTLVDEMRPNKQYLIVDSNEAGIAHALGKGDGNLAKAHNVLVQELPVDGKNMLLIDADRYSDAADETKANLVGRGIKEQGDINAFLYDTVDNGSSDATIASYAAALNLVWSSTQRIYPYKANPTKGEGTEYQSVTDNTYFFLEQEYLNEYLRANAGNDGETSDDVAMGIVTLTEKASEPRAHWKYEADSGLHLNPDQYPFAYLFYNWQNMIQTKDSSNKTITVKDNPAVKNFQVEMPTHASTNPAGITHIFELTDHRRVWIYERITNIDTISARVSDKSATFAARVEGLHESLSGATFTGDYIMVDTTHSDGTVTTEQVPITISMLSGDYNLSKVDTYYPLTVNYQGMAICTDYVLNIVDFVPNDYPEFPDEGAVRIDKQLDTTKYEYLGTGVASIDLSVTGIPAQTGVDMVIILDASGSMQRCVHNVDLGIECENGCGKVIDETCNRMAVLENELEELFRSLQQPIDGSTRDLDVAVATFNGYSVINSDYELYTHAEGKNNTRYQQIHEERPDASQILLPFTDIAKVDPEALNPTEKCDITYNSGTNYDRGMELAYKLLKAKQEKNAMDGVTREAIVVFMSDGIPYQFNYFHGANTLTQWNDYLLGTITLDRDCVVAQSEAVQSAFAKYYGYGKHWMAEAIKGDPSKFYKIIDPDAMTPDHITHVNGLGATLYTIGFGLGGENNIPATTCPIVLKRMASDESKYISASDNAGLKAAFSQIAGVIRSSGNAVFKDQIGKNFDLVFSNKINVINENGDSVTVDLTGNAPSITVKTYPLYKRSEIGTTVGGVKVTETMVGTRKPGEPTILEKVTFNETGTVIKSNKKTASNILNSDGVICASTFWYNTDTVAHNITLSDKTVVSLEPETFYWNIGDIPQDELVLSYSVYLEGSMEGLRPEGTYDTNEYARLSYTNYLGNDCELVAPKPKLPWHQGTVGYAFYLVNSKGQPIINQSNGAVGSFENAVKITEIVYKDFYLNSVGQQVMADVIEADNVMPEGYTLFDPSAKYEVTLTSTGEGSYTVINGKNVKTTYVQGVADTSILPEEITTNTADFVTANTVVWFAVMAETRAVPDTVVIDYGLPVDIDVLKNDIMMGDYGSLNYIANDELFPVEEGKKLWEELQGIDVVKTPKFSSINVPGTYGDIEVLKTADNKSTGKVRYTLDDTKGMKMSEEETFVYAVEYTGSVGTQGYYYTTVTVIPATTIYYEDNFVTYKVKNYEDGTEIKDKNAVWVTEGETVKDAVQDEDRPGQFSLSDLDANNIYGYDSNYTDMLQYSLGSAKKITVGAVTLSTGEEVNVYGTAEFSFSGTGFDVVSVTSDKTGTIVVKVKGTSAAGEKVSKNYIVDTYYGYMYTLCNVVYRWSTFGNTDPKDDKWIMIPVSVATGAKAEKDVELPKNPKDGDEVTGAIKNAWIVDKSTTPYGAGKNALYQIPVMKVSDLPYGTYNVTISASYRELFDHDQYETDNYDFYLDAIRVYNPANDGAGNETIEDAYKADGEGWPSYKELRNLLIGVNDFNSMVSGKGSGAIFIDNTKSPSGKTYTIEDYKNYGPNNEVYLAPGQAVAFKLEAGEYVQDGVTKYGNKIAGIHLAMKAVNGKTSVKVYDANYKIEDIKPQSIESATDLYYDITELNGRTVVIHNSGSSILSITNIKTTHTEAVANDEISTNMVVDYEVAALALASLNPTEEPPAAPEVPETSEPEVPETSEPEVPETSEPEVPETTEPEAFEPEKVNVKVNSDRVKVGSMILVTVTTSDDVDSITINGVEVVDCTGNRRKGIRTWRVRVKAYEIGEMELAVVCYNSENQASEPVVETVTVTSEHNMIHDRLEDILLGMLNGLRKKG